jgi:hypothetical protein
MPESPETPTTPVGQTGPPTPPNWKRKPVRGLKPLIAEQIVGSIHRCNTLTDAAQAAGVALPTLERWLTRGRQARSGIYHDFAVTVGVAQVEAKERLVSILGDAADSDPRWAAWLLSKKYPREYGDRIHHVVEAEMDLLLDAAQVVLTPEDYVRLLSEIAARRSGGTTAGEAPAVPGQLGSGIDAGGGTAGV